ncbi:hypothetical protein L7F22_000509 [Adiantum nelumboides]|nr:hypothetical protein [Adiantum nelumboides]
MAILHLGLGEERVDKETWATSNALKWGVYIVEFSCVAIEEVMVEDTNIEGVSVDDAPGGYLGRIEPNMGSGEEDMEVGTTNVGTGLVPIDSSEDCSNSENDRNQDVSKNTATSHRSGGHHAKPIRAQTIVDEPTEDVPITETSLTLVHLPYFHLNGKDYITLHSIQSLFNIREDYCLAVILEASQVAKDFVDIEGESKEEFLALDLETSNQKFLEVPYAFEFCLKELLKRNLFLRMKILKRGWLSLELTNLEGILKSQTKLILIWEKKINLEHEGQIEADELQKIELLDEDNFLGRAGGSRATSKYTGHVLIHYVPKLEKDVFCAFHSQFSDHLELSMFAIKTLSRFMGFLPLPKNVNRILLLERAAAFRIFGYAPGFHGSRAGYFLCYSSYVISNNDTNVKLLAGYKRRKFLRYRGKLPESSATKRLKK